MATSAVGTLSKKPCETKLHTPPPKQFSSSLFAAAALLDDLNMPRAADSFLEVVKVPETEFKRAKKDENATLLFHKSYDLWICITNRVISTNCMICGFMISENCMICEATHQDQWGQNSPSEFFLNVICEPQIAFLVCTVQLQVAHQPVHSSLDCKCFPDLLTEFSQTLKSNISMRKSTKQKFAHMITSLSNAFFGLCDEHCPKMNVECLQKDESAPKCQIFWLNSAKTSPLFHWCATSHQCMKIRNQSLFDGFQ